MFDVTPIINIIIAIGNDALAIAIPDTLYPKESNVPTINKTPAAPKKVF